MLEKVILDADFCIKLGESEKYRFLEDIVPLIAENVLMHAHAYSEVRYPNSAVEQLKKLVADGAVHIVDETLLPPQDRMIYNLSYSKLANVMLDRRFPNKNCGEVCSLAYAKATGVPVFATDERDLQVIVDTMLNTGIDDISCMRIVDLIYRAKSGEVGISRKQAKQLWVIAGKGKDAFDKDVWPLDAQ